MNRRQRYAMLGFLLGLAMIASMNFYFYPYIVMVGFILSLSCVLAYSLLECYPEQKIIKKSNKVEARE